MQKALKFVYEIKNFISVHGTPIWVFGAQKLVFGAAKLLLCALWNWPLIAHSSKSFPFHAQVLFPHPPPVFFTVSASPLWNIAPLSVDFRTPYSFPCQNLNLGSWIAKQLLCIQIHHPESSWHFILCRVFVWNYFFCIEFISFVEFFKFSLRMFNYDNDCCQIFKDFV